jgi:hypothetical protein
VQARALFEDRSSLFVANSHHEALCQSIVNIRQYHVKGIVLKTVDELKKIISELAAMVIDGASILTSRNHQIRTHQYRSLNSVLPTCSFS